MERTTLVRRFEQSEAHVAEGQRHIERQRAIVARLERSGLDCENARSTLTLFEEMQVLHVANRDRLIEVLQNAEEWEQFQKFG